MFSWNNVRGLSNAKIVSSTAIWVFLVPAFIKVFNSIDNNYVAVELPFSFLVLYFSGVSFFLGAVIYNLFCPGLVKDFDGYASFKSDGQGCYSIDRYLMSVNDCCSIKLKEELISNVGEASSVEIDSSNIGCINIGKNNHVYSFNNEQLGDVFWIVYHDLASKRQFFMYLSLLFHVLGALGLVGLFVYNFILVFRGFI